MAVSLYLNTVIFPNFVAVVKDNKLVEEFYSYAKKTVSSIVPIALNFFKRYKIDNINVIIGPGSFTGIKVSIALLKGLDFDKVFGFYSVDPFLARGVDKVYLQAYQNQVFVGEKKGEDRIVKVMDWEEGIQIETKGFKVEDFILAVNKFKSVEVKPFYLKEPSIGRR